MGSSKKEAKLAIREVVANLNFETLVAFLSATVLVVALFLYGFCSISLARVEGFAKTVARNLPTTPTSAFE